MGVLMMFEVLIIGALAGWMGYSTVHSIKKTNGRLKELEETIEERYNRTKESNQNYADECKQLNQAVSKLTKQLEQLHLDKNALQNELLLNKNDIDSLRFELKHIIKEEVK